MISVVIPVHNRVYELKRALHSVFSQTVPCDEIIVVENNSTPENCRLIRDEVELLGDSRINLVSLTVCENANVARNHGASLANSNLIAFLDSDDEWEDHHIENCLSIFKDHNCDFVYGAAKVFDGENFIVKESRQIGENERPLDFLLGNRRGYAQTSSYVLRKNFLERVKWDESLARHQDYDFFSRAVKAGTAVCNTNPDCIIHWKKGERREFDFQSIKKFHLKSRRDMSIPTEIRYVLLMIYCNIRALRIKYFAYYLGRLFMVFIR